MNCEPTRDMKLEPFFWLDKSEVGRRVMEQCSLLFPNDEIKDLKGTLSVVLGNMTAFIRTAEELGDEGPEWVYYSRDTNFYSVLPTLGLKKDCGGKERYGLQHWTRTKIVRVIDVLKRNSLIDHVMGKRGFNGEKGLRSKMRPTDELRQMLIGVSPREELQQEVIVLRSELAQLRNYLDTRFTDEARRRLREINRCNALHDFRIRIDDQQIRDLATRSCCIQRTPQQGTTHRTPYSNNEDAGSMLRAISDLRFDWRRNADAWEAPLRTWMTRIFSRDSFELGGRFYRSDIQNISKELREHVVIDGMPSVELDYSGLHLRMLYHREGKSMGGKDPYEFPGHPDLDCLRPATKKLSLIAINADSRRSALKAFTNSVKDEGWKLPERYRIPQLLDIFEARHDAISRHFYSDAGIKLQRLDSDIAEQIMIELAVIGKPVACVHDSFVVKDADQELLHEVMMAAYRDKLGQEPIVKGKFY